ncbi:hypothetical protein B0F90DRAFT_1669278 [Multifurca ochricompacta]|uniref:Major facilitator superfamily (MFS) profile domain-containing protein n=1 Tax=Multifurca ochricompacta TaxID=376703 RepID=A0AAD4M128_9AGAM|nr:hypothetical protein B0F90DRAFT_1669278 [Multifurca ochricompacta]
MLLALLLFAVGSAICGPASSMNMLIAGRTVQGLGAGAITSSVQIMLSDLVTLRERGTFSGLMALSWAVGGGVGPVIGGSLAQSGNWCHLLVMMLPSEINNIYRSEPSDMRVQCDTGSSFHASEDTICTLKEKLSRMDFIGNILITGSTTSTVIGLTWGGVQFAWSSASVLVPLIIGLVGLGVFIIYEIYLCKPPVVPILFRLDWTGISGYLQQFIMAMVLASLSYWYVIFFEACKDKSPTGAGVDIFGLSYSISLIAIVAGVVVKKTGKYLIPTYVGWVLMVIGAGLLTTIEVDTTIAKSVGFQLVIGSGIGTIYVASIFPILASIPVTQTAPAMALYVFSRNFGQGVEIAYATIPIIPSLQEPFKDQVRDMFGEALEVVWQVVLGITFVGFLCSLGIRQYHLHTNIDENWGRQDMPVDRWSSPNLEPSGQLSRDLCSGDAEAI